MFILKIRCSSTTNILNFIYTCYCDDGKKLYRRYETTCWKIIKTNLDLKYLIKCKTYELFPKFIRFKLYKKCLQTSSFYRSWQMKLLNYEINCKNKLSSKYSDDIANLKQELESNFSKIDNYVIEHFVKKITEKKKQNVISGHKKKLHKLGIDNELGPVNPDSVVYNYSSITISHKLKTLLAFGLDFALPVYKINFFSYFMKFESLVVKLKKLVCTEINFNEFLKNLQTLSYKYYYNVKSYKVFTVIFGRK